MTNHFSVYGFDPRYPETNFVRVLFQFFFLVLHLVFVAHCVVVQGQRIYLSSLWRYMAAQSQINYWNTYKHPIGTQEIVRLLQLTSHGLIFCRFCVVFFVFSHAFTHTHTHTSDHGARHRHPAWCALVRHCAGRHGPHWLACALPHLADVQLRRGVPQRTAGRNAACYRA